MTLKWARAALSHPAFTGISRAHLADLIEELAGSWTSSCESALHHRRGRKRKRQAGAGPKHELLFTDRVVVTLVHLRLSFRTPPSPSCTASSRSTITRAIGEIRPLLAQRGFADGQGRTLWSGADRPGRMHDQTAMRTEGIAEQFRLRPGVKAEVDEGYRGLANEFPEQVSAPPRKPKVDAPGWRETRLARGTPAAVLPPYLRGARQR